MDSEYKRLQYVRYADDWICGVIGSKADAEKVKSDIKKFLSEELKLELSEEKTLITNAHDKAHFLGFDVFASDDQQAITDINEHKGRFYTGRIKLYDTPKNGTGKHGSFFGKCVSEVERVSKSGV